MRKYSLNDEDQSENQLNSSQISHKTWNSKKITKKVLNHESGEEAGNLLLTNN